MFDLSTLLSVEGGNDPLTNATIQALETKIQELIAAMNGEHPGSVTDYTSPTV